MARAVSLGKIQSLNTFTLQEAFVPRQKSRALYFKQVILLQVRTKSSAKVSRQSIVPEQ